MALKLEVPSEALLHGLRWGPHKSCEALLIMHCERQALWRGVCPRRAERGALARAGMARAEMRQRARAGAGDTGDTYLKQHDAICPSRRRPLFPISGTTLRLCGPPMMAKTVLDLLHSLGVDDADIRFDNFGG